MARLNFVKKAQKTKEGKAPRTCGKCGKEIQAGDSYYNWVAWFRGPTKIRCADHKPEPWETEGNEKRAAIMRGQNAYGQAQDAGTPEEAAGFLMDAISEAETARDAFQEAVDGWSGGNLEFSEMAQNFEAAAADLDSWINEAESVSNDLQERADTEGEEKDEDEDEEPWQDLLTNLDEFPDPDF